MTNVDKSRYLTATISKFSKILLGKSAIFHPNKLPFDAEAAKKFLKVIYCKWTLINGFYVVTYLGEINQSKLIDNYIM